MQRMFHSKEDRKFALRWLLINVTAYSTAALMIVLFALSPSPRDAGSTALRGPTPSLSRGQAHTVVAAQAGPMESAAFIHPLDSIP